MGFCNKFIENSFIASCIFGLLKDFNSLGLGLLTDLDWFSLKLSETF